MSTNHFKISSDYFVQYVENDMWVFVFILKAQVISGQSLSVSECFHVKDVEPK